MENHYSWGARSLCCDISFEQVITAQKNYKRAKQEENFSSAHSHILIFNNKFTRHHFETYHY